MACALYAGASGPASAPPPPSRRATRWPQYRGPNGDAAVPGVKLPTVWPKSLTERGRVPLARDSGSPVVVGDRLYITAQDGKRESVLCLERGDRQDRLAARLRRPLRERPGRQRPARHAAVDAGPRLLRRRHRRNGLSHAVDGAVLWRKSFRAEFRARTPDYGLSPSPLIDGDRR